MKKWFSSLDDRLKGLFLGFAVILLDLAILRRHLETETRIAVEFTIVALGVAAMVQAKHSREWAFWLTLVSFALLHGVILLSINIPEVFDRPVVTWLPLLIFDAALMGKSIDWVVGRLSKADSDQDGVVNPSEGGHCR